MFKKLAAQTSLYSISNSLAKLSGLILLPLYANLLPLADYGLLGLFETISIFVIALSGMGLRAALPRWYWLPEKSQLQKPLYFSVVVASVVFGILTAGLSYFLAIGFSDVIFQTEVAPKIIGIFIISVFFRILNEIPFLILKINQKALSQTLFQSVNLILTVLFTYYAIYHLKLGLYGIFMAQMFSAIATTFITLPVVFKYISPRFLKSDFVAMIRFGFPLAMSNVLGIVLSLSDRFILNYFIDLKEVGTFSLASKVANVLQLIVITSFLSAYTHIFYQGMNRGGHRRLFSKAPSWFWLLIIVAALGMTLFGKEIIVVTSYSNPEYWNSIDVLPLLVAGLLFGGIRQLFVLDLSYHHQTRAISLSIVASGIVNILLNLALIPFWHSNGAAIATALTQLSVSAFLYLRIKKVSVINYEIRKMFQVFILATLVAVAGIYLNHTYLWLRLPLKGALLVGFFVSLRAFRYFDPSELNTIKGFWVKWRNPLTLMANLKKIKDDELYE